MSVILLSLVRLMTLRFHSIGHRLTDQSCFVDHAMDERPWTVGFVVFNDDKIDLSPFHCRYANEWFERSVPFLERRRVCRAYHG